MTTATAYARLIALAIFMAPMISWGDLQIQSVQYKPAKGALYVKGRLTDLSVERVYVVNGDTMRPLSGSGAIDTYARGSQFNAEIPLSASTPVPCLVRVQTNRPSAFFGSLFWSGARTSGGDPVQYSIATVRHAPESCAGE